MADKQYKNLREFSQSECVHSNVDADDNVTTEIWKRELIERGSKTEIGDRVGTEALKAKIQIAGLS